MIPVALSGDRSYNKDNIRRYVLEGERILPGSSTIDSETHQVFPNRTCLGPKGRIRRQADFGTTSLVVPKGIISETPTT